MLNERFLTRLGDAFPTLYDRANADALESAQRIRGAVGDDLEKALVRARFEGAARVWWPYMKGSVPLVGRDEDAMRAFTTLVLTVDHLVGHPPPTQEAARDRVVGVLRQSLDVDRLLALVRAETKKDDAKAGAGAGVAASMTALMAPLTAFRSFRRWARFVPTPLRVTLAAVVVAAVASLPLVAGLSAGRQAAQTAGKSSSAPRLGDPPVKR